MGRRKARPRLPGRRQRATVYRISHLKRGIVPIYKAIVADFCSGGIAAVDDGDKSAML